mmetsp:Transcript_54841/g.107292  ORF Transcript_54841/g.107292 Transcript_54841/m.107292 type:complete len:132 (+) Transcript_54841:914-1309(+)
MAKEVNGKWEGGVEGMWEWVVWFMRHCLLPFNDRSRGEICGGAVLLALSAVQVSSPNPSFILLWALPYDNLYRGCPSLLFSFLSSSVLSFHMTRRAYHTFGRWRETQTALTFIGVFEKFDGRAYGREGVLE